MIDLGPIRKAIEALLDFGKYLSEISKGIEDAVFASYRISGRYKEEKKQQSQAEILVSLYKMMPVRMGIINAINEYCDWARYSNSREDLQLANWLDIQKEAIRLEEQICDLNRRFLPSTAIPAEMTIALQKLMFASQQINKFFLENSQISGEDEIKMIRKTSALLQVILSRIEQLAIEIDALRRS